MPGALRAAGDPPFGAMISTKVKSNDGALQHSVQVVLGLWVPIHGTRGLEIPPDTKIGEWLKREDAARTRRAVQVYIGEFVKALGNEYQKHGADLSNATEQALTQMSRQLWVWVADVRQETHGLSVVRNVNDDPDTRAFYLRVHSVTGRLDGIGIRDVQKLKSDFPDKASRHSMFTLVRSVE